MVVLRRVESALGGRKNSGLVGRLEEWAAGNFVAPLNVKSRRDREAVLIREALEFSRGLGIHFFNSQGGDDLDLGL
jgi:hypothetical protein